jgi:hypothetical protein
VPIATVKDHAVQQAYRVQQAALLDVGSQVAQFVGRHLWKEQRGGVENPLKRKKTQNACDLFDRTAG